MEIEKISVFKSDMFIGDIRTILCSMMNSIDWYFNERMRVDSREFNRFVKSNEIDLMYSILNNLNVIKLSVDEIFQLRREEAKIASKEAEKSNLIQGPWAGSEA